MLFVHSVVVIVSYYSAKALRCLSIRNLVFPLSCTVKVTSFCIWIVSPTRQHSRGHDLLCSASQCPTHELIFLSQICAKNRRIAKFRNPLHIISWESEGNCEHGAFQMNTHAIRQALNNISNAMYMLHSSEYSSNICEVLAQVLP